MEETLGKRIVTNRKRLGLTQDQLAERLGVTAQAVSKWENDQSCPDITMLPKLAEIFGTTTDALLGLSNDEPVHEATVVTDGEAKDGFQFRNGNWEFKYDNSRTNGIFLAILALTVGSLYLVCNILQLDIGLWDIVWPSALLVFGVRGLFPRFSFVSLGVAIFGGYFLADRFFRFSFSLNSGIIISVVILLIGGAVLIDALRKPEKSKFQFQYHGNANDSNPRHDYQCTEDSFEFNGSFGDYHQNVELARLSNGEINTSFGDFTLDLSGVRSVDGGCELEANTSFGNLFIRVPKQFRVVSSSSTSFATVEFEGTSEPNPTGVIHLEANVSFGQILVQYI